MEKNLVKYLSTVALIAITLELSACAAMKPDHPQVRESFGDRRAPRDNMLAASGAFGEKKEDTGSAFQAIVPTSVVENRSGILPSAVSQVTHSQPTSTGTTQSAPSSSSANSGSGDFFSRFADKISSAFKTSSVEASKRSPKSNAYAMNASYSDVEQGSKSGYSFYEIADEILPSNPVHTIYHQEIPSLTSEKSLVKNAEFGYISKSDRVHLAQADTSATPAVPAAPSFPTDASKNVAPAPSQPAAPVATAPAVMSAPVVSSTPAQPITITTPTPTIPAPAPVIAAPVMETKVVPQAPELPSATPAQQPVVSTPAAPSVSSAPLTVVPSTPSVSDIKEKSSQQPEPQLKDTPKVPEEFKSQTSEPVKMEEPKKEEPVVDKQKPKKKAVKKIKLPKEESRDPVAQNPNSQTIYMMNGKKVTTGFLDNPKQ
jgi:hypothetical protein